MTKIITYLLIGILSLTIPVCAAENEFFDGDTVFVDNTDFKITATPHTLYESGYVEFTVISKGYTGNIDLLWGFNKATAKIIAVQSENVSLRSKDRGKDRDKNEKVSYERVNVKPKLTNKIFDKKHLWYDHSEKIFSNNELKIRCWFNVTFDSVGKYDFMVKPSYLSLEEAENNNMLWVLDPWYDSTFKYKKPLNIYYNCAPDIKDMQINLNFSYEPGMNESFNDVRFVRTEEGGELTVLPYWIENKNASNWCNVWILGGTFEGTAYNPSGWTNGTINMYYGNPNVVCASNNTTTFIQSHLFSNTAFQMENVTQSPYIFETKMFAPDNSNHDRIGVSNNPYYTNEDSTYFDLNDVYAGIGSNLSVYCSENGASDFYPVRPIDYKAIARYKIENKLTEARYYVDGGHIHTLATCLPTGHSMGIRFEPHSTTYINWSFIRTYAGSDPVVYVGSESSLFLIYNSTEVINNQIDTFGEVTAFGGNRTRWVGKALSGTVNLTISDYDTGTGTFTIINGTMDTIGLTGFNPEDIVYLTQGDVLLESGIVDENGEYNFISDLYPNSYTITARSYTDITGVHGFVYQGSSAQLPLKDVSVYIYNSTWSDTTFTDSGGYYAFVNLTNTTYVLSFKKDRYEEVLYQYVTPTNLSMYRKDIFMQEKSGDFYSRHYVSFILRNTFGVRYSGVDTTVYSNSAVEDVGVTGYDGGVVFHLFEDQEYRITFINNTQSVNEEITLYPRDSSYVIYVGKFSFTPSNDSFFENVQWYYVKNNINLTHAWLNFSYCNPDNKTTYIEYWINNSNTTSPYTFFYTAQTYPCSAGTYQSNNIVNASNHTYLVHFSALHPDYPSLAQSGLQSISFYTKKLIDLLFAEQWQYTATALCILIFLGMLFGATNAAKGSLIIILSAWFFSYIQWLPASIPGYGALVLASILAVGWNLRKNEVVHV